MLIKDAGDRQIVIIDRKMVIFWGRLLYLSMVQFNYMEAMNDGKD